MRPSIGSGALLVALTALTLLPGRVASGGGPERFDTVQAIAGWTRVDPTDQLTWTGSIAIFGPFGSEPGFLGMTEQLVPVPIQCTGQDTPLDPGDDTFGELTGNPSYLNPTDLRVTLDRSLRHASAVGLVSPAHAWRNTCDGSTYTSQTGPLGFDLQLRAVGGQDVARADGLMTHRRSVTATLTIGGQVVPVTIAEISRATQ